MIARVLQPRSARSCALHSIDVRVAAEAAAPPDLIGRLDRASRIPKSIKRFEALQHDGVIGDISPLLDFLTDSAPEDSGETVIVHGDLYARHLLLDDDQNLTGVIDWGDVHVGHPASDLMVAHIMLPVGLHSTFRESYGPITQAAWHLARMRTIYHTAMVLSYAHAIGDTHLLDAGLTSLGFLLEGVATL